MTTGFLARRVSACRKRVLWTLLTQHHHLKEIELQHHKLPHVVIRLEIGDLRNAIERPLSYDLRRKGM